MSENEFIIDEADAMSQAGTIPSQLDPEVCANGRPHRGGMDPEWYKYDMSDDEWYGREEW